MGDFSVIERDLLAALKHDGARLLEEQLNDPALPGPENRPQADEENFGPRSKLVLTCLGWITLRRSYFYSATRQAGRFPLDADLGLVDSYWPGVARWMCRAGTLAGSYQAASQDLLTYAGLDIDARQIQRLIVHLAPQHGPVARNARAGVLSGGGRHFLCQHRWHRRSHAPQGVAGAQRQARRQSPHP